MTHNKESRKKESDKNMQTVQPQSKFAPPERLGKPEIQRQSHLILDQAFLSRLYEAVMNAVVILNQHRQIVYCNRNFARFAGFSRPEEAYGLRPGEAIALFLGLCLVSFLMVVLFTNTLTLYLSFGGVLLAFIYPFMKRYTHLPQLFLGAAFSWAIPMAWAAEAGEVTRVAWLLFTANVLWTVAYDTLYAMVDRDDDLKVGIKSTAILFGDADKAIIGMLQGMVVLILIMVGHRAELGTFYYLGVVAMACLFVYHQYLAREREREGCFKAFLNNNWAGFAVFAGLVIDLIIG